MRLALFLVITAVFLQSCGSGDTTPASSTNPGGVYQTSKSYSFTAKVDSATLTRQRSIGLNATYPSRPETYVINSAEDLDALNQSLAFPELNEKISLEDLGTYTYFLIRTPDCPTYAEWSHNEYDNGRLAIVLNTFEFKKHSCPAAEGIDAYDLYRAQKTD